MTEATVPEAPVLLPRREVSSYIFRHHGVRVAEKTLASMVTRGGGPAYFKFGRDTLYAPAEIDRWIAAKLLHVVPEGV